jgi:8-oxo-dGTP diphosphatase
MQARRAQESQPASAQEAPVGADDLLLDPSGFPDPGRPRYCARCGAALEERERGGRRRPVCPRCGWTYYAKNAIGAAVLIERPAVAGAGKEVLLVQRAHEPYRDWWMLPAGFVEYGERAEATAVREAREECGIEVRLDGLFGVYFGTDDPRNPSYLLVYRAHPVDEGATLVAGDDARALGWFAAGALPERIAFEGHRQALADWQRSARPR